MKIISGSTKTAERPQALEADAWGRYELAKKMCKAKEVLDVGCGFGLGSELVLKSGAKRVLGVDYSKDTIAEAKKNEKEGLTFEAHDALKLGTIKDKFDVILAFEILEHLPLNKVDTFISGIRGLLKKDGVLLLSTPNGVKTEYFWGRPYNTYHVKEYGGYELKHLLGREFGEVELNGYTTTNKKYKSAQRVLQKSFVSKVIHFVGAFRLSRELFAFIPRDVKRVVTKENTLPATRGTDYVLDKNWIACDGLFVKASGRASRAKNKLPFVSVVIPNFNGAKYLESCIASVLEVKYPEFEVIISDDASTDESVRIANSYALKNKKVRVIENPKNMGASASKNNGVAAARAEIVVFLDSDTEVKPDFLTKLISELISDEELAACQSVIMDYDDRALIQQAGGIINPLTGWLSGILQWQKYAEEKKKGTLRSRYIAGVSGSLAVKRHFFERVRGFDEREARHSEDVDFSWRMWVAGGKIKLISDSLIFHKNKPMSDRALMNASKEYIHFHLTRNSIRSIIKNYELVNVIKYLPVAISLNIARLLLAFVKFNPSIILGTSKAIWWNITNFGDNLSERRFVQKNRQFSDKMLFKNIFVQDGAKSLIAKYLR